MPDSLEGSSGRSGVLLACEEKMESLMEGGWGSWLPSEVLRLLPNPPNPTPHPPQTTNLVQHHITDMGQSLRLLHTGKDELKAKQELTVITLFLLKV